jgi:hypothetical protein
MQRRNQACRSFAIVVLCGALLEACSPGFSPAQVQSMVQTAVVGTIESQNQMGTAVALTVSALAPLATATSSPTPITPTVMTATPFVLVPTAGKKLVMACDISQKPSDETAYKPGDPFDIKWTITNTGTKTMNAGMDFKYAGGTHLTTATSFELPEMQPNAKYSVSFDANAPLEKGRYVMTWIVEGGLCSTSVVIVSGRPGIDP